MTSLIIKLLIFFWLIRVYTRACIVIKDRLQDCRTQSAAYHCIFDKRFCTEGISRHPSSQKRKKTAAAEAAEAAFSFINLALSGVYSRGQHSWPAADEVRPSACMHQRRFPVRDEKTKQR